MAREYEPVDTPEAWLRDYCERFAREGNPLHAWAAWKTARAADLAVPDWVLGYLDECANGLIPRDPNRDPDADRYGPPGKFGRLLGFAVGLKKSRQLLLRHEQQRVALRTIGLMFNGGLALEAAAQESETEGLSRAKVLRLVAAESEDEELEGLISWYVKAMTGEFPELRGRKLLRRFSSLCRERGRHNLSRK